MPDPSTPHQAAHRSAPVYLFPAAAYKQFNTQRLQSRPQIASMLSHGQEGAKQVSPVNFEDGCPLGSIDKQRHSLSLHVHADAAVLKQGISGAGAVIACRAEHAHAVDRQRPRLGAPPARQRLQRGGPPPQFGWRHHLYALGNVRGLCRGVLRLGA